MKFFDDYFRKKMISEKELIYLTVEQINEICEELIMPFNGIDLVISSINSQLKKISKTYLENTEIYDGMFDQYKNHLKNKFLSSLIEAGTPIGAITSDAIGQQATQALLNTFHSVGSMKSGGPDGIKENIGISNNRKILYSIIHMKNSMMKFSDVMKLKKKFIGLTISDLLLETPESIFVDIRRELMKNPLSNDMNVSERKKIFKSKSFWWYSLSSFQNVLSEEEGFPSKRTCLRLKFDIQKLFEYDILIYEIANYLTNLKEPFKKPKVDIKDTILAIPSPTIIGVIDLFVKSLDDSKDYLLISLIHDNKFKNLVINGIEGISKFDPVSTSVIRLIRDVEETNRFDEENKKKGMWIYFNENRFNGIPYSRVLNLFDKAGLNYEKPYFKPESNFNKDYTDLPFDFFSHKIIQELKSSFKLRAYLLFGMQEHEIPFYYDYEDGIKVKKYIENNHYTFDQIKKGFEVAILFDSEMDEANGIVSRKKFKNQNEVLKFVASIENRLTKKKYNLLFDYDLEDFFENQNNQSGKICFEFKGNNDEQKFMSYFIFQFNYIDYNIDVNLDYVNSQFVTQSLESVLLLQFAIPLKLINERKIFLPDSLRKYKISKVKNIEQFERRILLKSKMFLTDKYDFLADSNRNLSIKYFREAHKDFTTNEKIALIIKLCYEFNVEINQKSLEYFSSKKLEESNNDSQVKYFDSLLNGTKITPLERLLKYLKDHTEEDDSNYVYAETAGSNFAEIITNPILKANKTICNNFYQVYACLGIEGLRNTLDYDLINMINNSGYISVEYMNLLTNVTTHNGINPMTSEGISCQGRDYLAMASFDNAPKYIQNAALLGEEHSTQSVSTCIFLGKNFKLGTGFAKISFDKTKLTQNNKKEGISYGFLKLTGIKPNTDKLTINDNDVEELIYVPRLVSYKFPLIPWIMDNFIQKDLYFYIKQGINLLKSTKLSMFKIKDCNANLNSQSSIKILKFQPCALPKFV